MKDFVKFRKLLDEQYQWPAVYLFKFIVPRAGADRLLAMFAGCKDVSVRESGKGTYCSITARMIMPSSERVIAVYEAVADIEGIISL